MSPEKSQKNAPGLRTDLENKARQEGLSPNDILA